MPETWRLIVDEPDHGTTNMARDEAIAVNHAAGATPPTLRLYCWRPACLSLGRFQRSGEIDLDACKRTGVAVVRRPSGGRALLHDDELTYAIVARVDHPLFGGEPILETYRRISLALLAGLRKLGVKAELTSVQRADRRPREQTSVGGSSVAGRRSSAACFDAPAAYELTLGGRKLVGSAQTRRAGVILQHGAIPLSPHADRLAALLYGLPADLGAKMIALDEAAGRKVDVDELTSALVAGFEETWNVVFDHGTLAEEEWREETRLLAEKYANDRWTYGR